MSKDSPSQSADRIVVRLPDNLRERFKAIAKANHRSMSNMAVVALEDFVEKTASNHTA